MSDTIILTRKDPFTPKIVTLEKRFCTKLISGDLVCWTGEPGIGTLYSKFMWNGIPESNLTDLVNQVRKEHD